MQLDTIPTDTPARADARPGVTRPPAPRRSYALSPDVERFISNLFLICSLYGASVTSWLRSEKHNQDVGGARHSYHLDGLAADLVLDDHSRARALVDEAHRLGLDAENEGDHVHIELDVRRHRPLTRLTP